MKTDKEIKDKITELVDDDTNFTDDNYGSEAADNGEYEVFFSEYATTETLNSFVNWLYSKPNSNE